MRLVRNEKSEVIGGCIGDDAELYEIALRGLRIEK